MSFAGLAEILINQKVGPEHYLMRVQAPEISKLAKPGQFVHVRCNQQMDPLMRRPLSLHGIDHDQGTISLLYQVVGRGTRLMAEMPVGARIDVMGPLGRGFTIPEGVVRVMVIGGGIGAAPLFPLVQALRYHNIRQSVLLGARSADYIIGARQLSALDVKVETATDDGSMGHHGFVTELAELHIKVAKPDYFYACGPHPMLDRLLQITRKYGLNGQVSLEERMGCGVGACLACVCKTRAGGRRPVTGRFEAGAVGGWEYKKVCTDGPVFDASEVIIDG